MTTATLPSGIRLTGGGLLRSEWIKLRSLRSTVWSYALVVLVAVGMAALMAANFPVDGAPPEAHGAIAVQVATFGLFFGQLVVAVLGVLVISGEYSTGVIRSTLTADPRRLGALWAKTAVLFATTFVVGAVASIVSFLVAAPILSGRGVSASLLEPAVILPLLGGGLYLALVAVLGLGIGTILRSGAGGIAAALGLVLLLPVVLQMIPVEWAQNLVPYTFSQAGSALFAAPLPGDDAVDLWRNLAITVGWAVAGIGGGAVLLKRRDA